jgi:hypothetical protein
MRGCGAAGIDRIGVSGPSSGILCPVLQKALAALGNQVQASSSVDSSFAASKTLRLPKESLRKYYKDR